MNEHNCKEMNDVMDIMDTLDSVDRSIIEEWGGGVLMIYEETLKHHAPMWKASCGEYGWHISYCPYCGKNLREQSNVSEK